MYELSFILSGVLKFSVGDEAVPMEDVWKGGGLVVVVRGVEKGVDKLGVQNVSYSTVIRAVQTYVTLSCDTDGVWKGGYAYGFNGQRKDDEINGIGNHVDFGARGLDTRLGRWWSVDPLAEKYPSSSPYVFANNSPIILVDRDGREWRNAYDAQVANLQSLPNTRSVQRQLMAALDNQSKVNAILNELKKNDGALYNYIDNLKVSSKSGNEMPFKVFVGLGGRASANSELESSGIAGITEYIPSRIEGTYNGKPIRVPLTKEQDRFQVGARVTLYTDNVSAPFDVTLANEAGDVMYIMEYNERALGAGSDRPLESSYTESDNAGDYSRRVEDKYTERKKNPEKARDSNPYPLKLRSETGK